jgi:hypothetical protein
MLDGQYFLEPFSIPVSESENIEVLASEKGYYLNSQGELKSLYLPLIIKSGNYYYRVGPYVSGHRLDTDGADIEKFLPKEDELLRYSSLVGNRKGQLAVITFITDFDSVRNKFPKDVNSDLLYLFGLQEKYFRNNLKSINDFLEKGNINEKLFFAYIFSGGKVIL